MLGFATLEKGDAALQSYKTDMTFYYLGEIGKACSFGDRKCDLADLQKGYETLQSWRMIVPLVSLCSTCQREKV